MLDNKNIDMDTLDELERECLELEKLEREYLSMYPEKPKEN